MRQIDPKIIEERKKKILQAVIHHYIKTAKPVGSHVLTEDYHFDISPATVRAMMSELEEDGFLTHPHTSAGRVPTDKGYRSYVDSLMELQRLVVDEENRVRQEYSGRIQELQDLLVQTSRVLSGVSQYTGFVLTPKLERNLLKYLELVPLDAARILVVLVTNTGLVRHHLIEAAIHRDRLVQLNNLLNEKLRGLSLLEAKGKVMETIEEAQRQEHELMNLARLFSDRLFDVDEEVYLEGTSNVLTLPEFQDYEPMRCILRLSEERSLLGKVFEADLKSDAVRVHIGTETRCQELRYASVVSTVYKDGERPIGVLGIIGPKRMEYPKMMAIVGAVSRIVNKFLSKLGD